MAIAEAIFFDAVLIGVVSVDMGLVALFESQLMESVVGEAVRLFLPNVGGEAAEGVIADICLRPKRV